MKTVQFCTELNCFFIVSFQKYAISNIADRYFYKTFKPFHGKKKGNSSMGTNINIRDYRL